ncbi:hypothetical protein N7451_006594 [Penicillium sp. IBT 35674x]|nr:hypothetical protein N7451_006594 [Penicillium sp. IBT 35674x]
MAKEQPSSNNGQPFVPVIDMHNTESSEAAVRDLGSSRFDENSFLKSMTEADNNSIDTVYSQPAQLTSRYQDTVSENLVHDNQDPELTAGMDDWAFQGVDMAFFDSIMRGLNNIHSSETNEGPNTSLAHPYGQPSRQDLSRNSRKNQSADYIS